jgi:hypothetical protein
MMMFGDVADPHRNYSMNPLIASSVCSWYPVGPIVPFLSPQQLSFLAWPFHPVDHLSMFMFFFSYYSLKKKCFGSA